MKLPETYMPLIRYRNGGNAIECFAEVQPGVTLDVIVSDIMSGEFLCERILAIYRVAENFMTTDVSDDAAKAIVSRIIRGERASSQAKDFINWVGLREHDETIAEFECADF